MFFKNNDRINYPLLEERLAIDAARLRRRSSKTERPADQPKVHQTKLPGAGLNAHSEVDMHHVRERRSLPKKVALWFKSFFKLYRLADRTAEAERRFMDLSVRQQTLAQQFDVLDSRQDVFETRLDDLEPRLDDKLLAFKNDPQFVLEPQFDDKLLAFKNDQHVEIQRMIEQVGALRREIMFQQRRLTQLALPASISERVATTERVANERLDSFYVAFEDVFRGSREDIKGRLVDYVSILRDAGAGQLGKPVLDVGCGRGEWLELLKEANIPAYGVDINSVMVERTAALGLDARSADAIEHLKGLPDATLSGLTAFHVVEHLPFEVLIDFLDEALRVLAPGGIVIFETPNPETMRVGATTFYNDPTHRNPIPPQVMQFMIAQRGYQNTEILRLHPFTDGLLEQPTADAERLNRLLFGPQDYSVIARRL
jgi:O-antigen chain-terminating methyltransferase